MVGELTLEGEQMLVDHAHAWLTEQSQRISAYNAYLSTWGDWVNPWAEAKLVK